MMLRSFGKATAGVLARMPGRKQLGHAATAYPLYLLIFCIQSLLALAEIFPFYDYYSLMPALALLLAVAIALLAVCKLAFRNTQFASLVSLAGMLALFPKVAMAVPVYLAIAGIGLVLPFVRVWKKQAASFRGAIQLSGNFTYIANIAALAMLAVICARGVYSAYVVDSRTKAIADNAYASIALPPTTRPRAALPNIVHIVLDGYSRADVLRDVYGFDNTPFLEALAERGFRIADKATTPFNQTLFVMNEIFSLGASGATAPSEIIGEDPAILRRMLARGVEEGGVARILRDLGYELQSAPSTYLPLQWNNVVDAPGNASAWNHFGLPATYVLMYDLLKSSPVLGTLSKALLGPRMDLVSIDFQNLKAVPKRRFQAAEDRPLFIYQHILAPHPPFIITADGRFRPHGLEAGINDGSHLILGQENRRDRYREGYVEKLRYINSAILEQIDGVKESLPGPLVIVLHGDHGGGLHFDFDKVAETCLSERYSPLLAVYATDSRISAAIASDFNLVNLYRVILGKMLGTDLPLLPGRSTYVSWKLDDAARLQAAELTIPCTAPRKTWTAERPHADTGRTPLQAGPPSTAR